MIVRTESKVLTCAFCGYSGSFDNDWNYWGTVQYRIKGEVIWVCSARCQSLLSDRLVMNHCFGLGGYTFYGEDVTITEPNKGDFNKLKFAPKIHA